MQHCVQYGKERLMGEINREPKHHRNYCRGNQQRAKTEAPFPASRYCDDGRKYRCHPMGTVRRKHWPMKSAVPTETKYCEMIVF
jgi:hypothetical protein